MPYYGRGWSHGDPMGRGWKQVTGQGYGDETDYEREVKDARDYVKYSGDLEFDLRDPSIISSRALATIVHDKDMDERRRDAVRAAYAERGVQGDFTEKDRMYEHVAIFQNAAESLGHGAEVWLNEDDESIEIHYWDADRYPHDFRLGPEDGLDITVPPSLGRGGDVAEIADEDDPDWRGDDRNYPEMNAIVDALGYATQVSAAAERNYKENRFSKPRSDTGSQPAGAPDGLSEKQRAALRESYFSEGRAADDAGFCAEEMQGKFERFLSDIGCKESRGSEWDYFSPHSGIQAEVDPVRGSISPEPIDEEWLNGEDTGCELNIARAWEPHRERIEDLQGRIDEGRRKWKELDDQIGFHFYDDEPDPERDRLEAEMEKLENGLDKLEGELDSEEVAALEDVCEAYEKSLQETYDYYYSDEAADNWIDGLDQDELDSRLSELEPEEPKKGGIFSRIRSGLGSLASDISEANAAAQGASNPFGGDPTVSRGGKEHEGKPMVDGYDYVNKNGTHVHVDSYKNPRYKGPRR